MTEMTVATSIQKMHARTAVKLLIRRPHEQTFSSRSVPFVEVFCHLTTYSKTCHKRLLKKKTKIDFQDRLSLDAGQKYCRMLQGEHSAILSTFIKLSFVINIFVLSILSGRLRQVLLYIG